MKCLIYSQHILIGRFNVIAGHTTKEIVAILDGVFALICIEGGISANYEASCNAVLFLLYNAKLSEIGHVNTQP